MSTELSPSVGWAASVPGQRGADVRSSPIGAEHVSPPASFIGAGDGMSVYVDAARWE
jgi:hypothetical protein